MDKRLVFRLAMVLLLLYAFYVAGLPLESIAILGVLFIILILLRGKIWKKSEQAMEKYLPFTKTWPGWAHKILLFVIFILCYMVIRYVMYFVLGLAGIDIQEIILQGMDFNKEF